MPRAADSLYALIQLAGFGLKRAGAATEVFRKTTLKETDRRESLGCPACARMAGQVVAADDVGTAPG